MTPRILLLVLVAGAAGADEFGDAPLDDPEPAAWTRSRPLAVRELKKEGGTALTENALRMALQWLAAHQDDDGRWDNDGFMKHDPEDDRCGGPGGDAYDVGATALALLAFLGHGHRYHGAAEDDPHAAVVGKAVRFLLSAQGDDGRFGGEGRASIYEHAAATAALCDAYGVVRHPHVRAAAQRGLDFLAAARDEGRGWRYARGSGECDTSVTAWCCAALYTGRLSGLTIDEEAFAGARAWVDTMTDPRTGRTGYNTVGGPSWWHPETGSRGAPWAEYGESRFEAMTAAGICIRLFAGEDADRSKPVRAAAKVCAEALPRWDTETAGLDPCAWFWCAGAMHRAGGNAWRKWNSALQDAVVPHQHPAGSGSRTGSWDPVGPWARECGRVGTTALLALTLETYYRLP